MPRYKSVYAPPITKKTGIIALNSLIRTTKTGGGRGFAVSRKRESYGNNLLDGQIDERRHFEVLGKSVSGLCRVTSPFTPPPITKKTGNRLSFLLLVGAVGLEPMTSTMSR